MVRNAEVAESGSFDLGLSHSCGKMVAWAEGLLKASALLCEVVRADGSSSLGLET